MRWSQGYFLYVVISCFQPLVFTARLASFGSRGDESRTQGSRRLAGQKWCGHGFKTRSDGKSGKSMVKRNKNTAKKNIGKQMQVLTASAVSWNNLLNFTELQEDPMRVLGLVLIAVSLAMFCSIVRRVFRPDLDGRFWRFQRNSSVFWNWLHRWGCYSSW